MLWRENAIVTNEQQAAIWRQTRGDTVCAELAAAAREWPDLPAYSDRGSAGQVGAGPGWAERDWSTLTWRPDSVSGRWSWPPGWSRWGSSRGSGWR